MSFSSLLAVHGAGLVSIKSICALFTVNATDFDPDTFILHCSELLILIPNFTRMLLAVIFTGSFFLKPLKLPIMTLWARIIESDKPIFTLVLGGGASLVEAIHQIVSAASSRDPFFS